MRDFKLACLCLLFLVGTPTPSHHFSNGNRKKVKLKTGVRYFFLGNGVNRLLFENLQCRFFSHILMFNGPAPSVNSLI